MSTEIYRVKREQEHEDVTVTSFWGGEKRGMCVQLTGYMEDFQQFGYVQLTTSEIEKIIPYLLSVVAVERARLDLKSEKD